MVFQSRRRGGPYLEVAWRHRCTLSVVFTTYADGYACGILVPCISVLLPATTKNGTVTRYVQLAHNVWDREAERARPRILYNFGREELGRMKGLKERHHTSRPRIDREKVREETLLDGKHLLRTSDDTLSARDVVLGYKQLSEVERAFRCLKHDLELRPMYHRLEERIRAHVLLCWLAPSCSSGWPSGAAVRAGTLYGPGRA